MTQQPAPQSPVPPEGTTPEGTTPEGTTPEGTTPEGTTPEGMGPEGAPTEGTQQQPLSQFPWSSQPPEDGSQHTAPLWYEQTQTQAQPQYPLYPPVVPPTTAEQSPAAFTTPGAKPAASGKPRRLAEASVIALVAAVLASAGTYGQI